MLNPTVRKALAVLLLLSLSVSAVASIGPLSSLKKRLDGLREKIANVGSGTYEGPVYPPILYIGLVKPKHRVTFLWSSECLACRTVFNSVIANVYDKAAAGGPTALAIIQYEDQDDAIANATDAICKGKAFYEFWALGNLALGTTVASDAKQKSIKSRIVSVCDRELASEIVAHAFSKAKQLVVDIGHTAPVIILDGQRISAPALQQFISNEK